MEAVKQQGASSIFYDWIIVAISALGLFFSGPGQTYSISIFVDYYIRDFGWSSTLFSGIYSGATLVSGSLLFIVGRLVDRFRQRTMSVAVGLLLAILVYGIASYPIQLCFLSVFFYYVFSGKGMSKMNRMLKSIGHYRKPCVRGPFGSFFYVYRSLR